MRLNPLTHVLIFVALVTNLWAGGDLIQLWLGGPARQCFEVVLIFGYLWFVLGITVPLPWRRPAGERGDDERSA
ncbi:MAG: hypothetical protein O3B31_00055 [Chloroflexi bacterium]|nr:hypothetical protein [Chloroflexota bacterium]MDA1001736.1 hypothetical protein [Chloroflexota bacterium]